MKRIRCEEELAKIIRQTGKEYGFGLDSRQLPFLVMAVASRIDQHFGLEKDSILKKIKKSKYK